MNFVGNNYKDYAAKNYKNSYFKEDGLGFDAKDALRLGSMDSATTLGTVASATTAMTATTAASIINMREQKELEDLEVMVGFPTICPSDWDELFGDIDGKSSIYALIKNEVSQAHEWVIRGQSGQLVVLQNRKSPSDFLIKWNKKQQELSWRLIFSKLKPKGDRAWVLEALDIATNEQEVLAIRFSDTTLVAYDRFKEIHKDFMKEMYKKHPTFDPARGRIGISEPSDTSGWVQLFRGECLLYPQEKAARHGISPLCAGSSELIMLQNQQCHHDIRIKWSTDQWRLRPKSNGSLQRKDPKSKSSRTWVLKAWDVETNRQGTLTLCFKDKDVARSFGIVYQACARRLCSNVDQGALHALTTMLGRKTDKSIETQFTCELMRTMDSFLFDPVSAPLSKSLYKLGVLKLATFSKGRPDIYRRVLRSSLRKQGFNVQVVDERQGPRTVDVKHEARSVQGGVFKGFILIRQGAGGCTPIKHVDGKWLILDANHPLPVDGETLMQFMNGVIKHDEAVLMICRDPETRRAFV